MRYALIALAFACLTLGLASAQSDSADNPVERGRKLFLDTQELAYPACAHCHNTMPEKDELKKAKQLGPGVTLDGAATRAGWRNRDSFKNVGEALQYCAKTWQERPGGFKAAPLADLVAYLNTLGDGKPLPKRKVQRKPKLLSDLAGGDAEKGKALTARFCGGCHNAEDDAISFPLKPGRKRSELIARKVRGYDAKSKFKPQGGTMSYYTTDRLADADLRHIIAYLGR